jgi:hypothetical protein
MTCAGMGIVALGAGLGLACPPIHSALHGVRVEYFNAAVATQFLGYLSSRAVG